MHHSEKIILWLKHKTRRVSSAPSSSAPRSVCDLQQVTNSLFLLPLWRKWWRWCLFSAAPWVPINLHLQVFLIPHSKYIVDFTVLPPLFCINTSASDKLQPSCTDSHNWLHQKWQPVRGLQSHRSDQSAKGEPGGLLGAASLQACFAFTFWTCQLCHCCRQGTEVNQLFNNVCFFFLCKLNATDFLESLIILLTCLKHWPWKDAPHALTDSKLSTCWKQRKDFTFAPSKYKFPVLHPLKKSLNWQTYWLLLQGI